MTREFTNRLLEMVEDGLLDRDTVIMACVKYMSEDDVRDMMFANDFVEETEDWDEDYDDSMDGDFDSGMASAGYGMDEDYA